MKPGPHEITKLLRDWSTGDETALDRLMPLVYDELHRLAHQHMKRELLSKGRLDEAQPLLEDAIRKNSGDLRARARLALLITLRGKFREAEAAIPAILKDARNNRSYHRFYSVHG
jgi:thioredoxin-like negative regulator of GroEL